MRSKKIRALIIIVVCAALLGGALFFAFGGTPRRGEYVSEYGTHYYIDREEITRMDVAVELSAGAVKKDIMLNVVYTYSLYSEDFEERILMRLDRVVYEGEDTAVKNLVSSLNRDIAGGSDIKYELGNLSLKASTDGGYARGVGSVRINGELLKRK